MPQEAGKPPPPSGREPPRLMAGVTTRPPSPHASLVRVCPVPVGERFSNHRRTVFTQAHLVLDVIIRGMHHACDAALADIRHPIARGKTVAVQPHDTVGKCSGRATPTSDVAQSYTATNFR